MIHQAVQLPGIIQVGVDGFLVRVRLYKYGIIRLRLVLDGDVGTGICKCGHLFFGYADQFHVLAVHTPQIV